MAWLEARRVKFISKRVVWWAREAERALVGRCTADVFQCRRVAAVVFAGAGRDARRCRGVARGGRNAEARQQARAGEVWRQARAPVLSPAKWLVVRASRKGDRGPSVGRVWSVGFGRSGLVGEQGPACETLGGQSSGGTPSLFASSFFS